MGSKKKVTVGYRYYMGLHFGLCHGPVDQVQRIDVGEREAWSGSVTANSTIAISKPDLFGGDKKEGGIVGGMDILMGGASQAANAYLSSKLGTPISAFRGILSAVWKQGQVSANNPYVKPWAFKVKRILQGWSSGSAWYSAKAEISGDMNPAHIIYQCLTDASWGMGYPTASLDDTVFQNVADALYAEGFGLSIIWNQQSSIEDFIRVVLDHIGGVLYVTADTGKFAIKLIRGDYVKANLPLYDPSNLLSADDYQRQGWGETVNEITVIYRSMTTNKDVAVTVQDLANITTQGTVINQTKQYPGISNDALAKRVAQRDLNNSSTPLSRIRLKANREAWAEIPGNVIRLSWPDYGIDDVVFRILEVNRGTLQDGTITIDCAEDIFAFPTNSYIVDQPPQWTNPTTAPAPAPYRMLIETPYWDLATGLSPADFDYVDPLSAYLETLAARPSGDALDYELWTALSGSVTYKSDGDFCPHATLAAAVAPAVTSTILLADGVDLDLVVAGGYAIIGDMEYVKVNSINLIAGTVTVDRGVLDTVPQSHSIGARIWFADGYQAIDETEYAYNNLVYAKILPSTGQGTLLLAAASFDTKTFSRRHNRPYPPGGVFINSAQYPQSISVNAAYVNWSHRDRTQQTAELINQNIGSIGPEPGTTYNIRFYDGVSNTLRESATGLTGLNYWHSLVSTALLLHFDGANGSTSFVDEAGNSFTAYGNAQLSTADFQFGTASGLFDGTGDYIQCPADHSFNVGTGNFTIEFWINTTLDATGETVFRRIIAPRESTNGVGGLQIWHSGGTGVDLNANAISLAHPQGTSVLVSTVDAINDGNWHHVAFSRSGTILRAFLDGVLKQNVTDSTAFTLMGTEGIKIGGRADLNVDAFFNGSLDELRFIRSAVYTAAFTPPAAPFSIPAGDRPESIRIELESQRDGIISLQKHNLTIPLV